MLYSENDRTANDKIAGLIRNSFCGKEYSVPELDEYSYYLRLQDMIDFSSISFPKALKTTKTRVSKTTPGLISYRLNDNNIFELSIGTRVLTDEVEENGTIPIYSANVFEEFGRINKQNITDFSLPSILWGIDGDWMVNFLPANIPFYPTDHCGVLRVKTDDILPKYLAIALEVEGTFEKFSRNNRASIQRIKALTIQVPEDKNKQQKIIDDISILDDKIHKYNSQIIQINDQISEKFTKMFGDVVSNSKGLPTTKVINVVTLQRGYDLPEKNRNAQGSIPVYGSNGFVGFHSESKACNGIVTGRSGTIGEVHCVLGEYWPLNTSLFSSDTHGNNVIYLSYLLQNFHLERFFSGSGVPTLNRNDVHSEQIVDVPLSEQTTFATYASERHRDIEQINEEKKKIIVEREALIAKYFK